MKPHEQLSINIAGSDLLYVVGMSLSTGSHPRAAPLAQWSTMVAYEAHKHLSTTHGVSVQLSWDENIAEAARHGGKYFDGRGDPIGKVSADFGALSDATHAAFYPDDRLGRQFDFLRRDLSVITDGEEVLLTSVTGHYMLGLPSGAGVGMDDWGALASQQMRGVGEFANWLLRFNPEVYRVHGQQPDDAPLFWDADIAEVIPSAFAGELAPDLAFAVIGVLSTVQGARRWGRAQCCVSCASASLKYRFVTVHHALRSIQKVATRPTPLGPVAAERLSALVAGGRGSTLVNGQFRALRNGWLHLGLGDVADFLHPDSTALDLVAVYTGVDPEEFELLVDEELDRIAKELNDWLLLTASGRASLLELLHVPLPGS